MSDLIESRIGIIPSDWTIQPLAQSTTKIQDGTHFSPKTTDGPCRYLTSKNVRWGRLDLSDCGRISQQEHDAIYARCDVKYGDVLLTKDGANTGNACLNTLHEPFSLLSSVAILRTDESAHSASFILQYFLSPDGQRRLKDLMSGNAITRLTLQKIKAFETPVPPTPEQRKIARILTTVDNLIEKTEALIAKYQAIKQGMMHDLFTRGVDEHGHLRPPYEQAPELYKQSELGWIPKEWRETTVGNELLGIDAGKSPDCPDIPAPPGEWGVLKVSAVQPDGFRSTENKVVLNPVWVNPAYEVKEGDLLISRSNTYQLVGLVCLVHSPQQRLMLCDKTLRLRFNPREVEASFMFWLFQQPVVRRHIEVHATGTSGSMKNISQAVIRSAQIMLPPVVEQERITDRIEAIQDNIAAQRRTQEKLMIKKTGLMQDLLTGKVRVKVGDAEEVTAHA
ncbi:MAG: restriction endonuclease subunit S [Planctomycetaceae bacterium]|nr:restriction endonuclease subunit S [Planctomycetaceae bacterium]